MQSASAGGGNSWKTDENDISTKKQKQAVTSCQCSELQPVASSFRINAALSKNGKADGEGFDENDTTIDSINGCKSMELPCGAKNGAFSDNGILAPDDQQVLQTIITLWPDLSSEAKIKVMQTIEVMKSETKKTRLID